MKKILLSLSMASTVLLVACQDQDIPTLKVNISTIFSKEETIKYPPSKDEYTFENAQVEVHAELPETGIKWLDQLLIKKAYELVSETEDNKKDNPTKQELVQKLQQINEQLVSEAQENIGLGMSFALSSTYLGQRNNIVTFSNDVYTYSGGAHGMNVTFYQNIDTTKRKVIELNDVISQQQQAKLKEILWQSYDNLIQRENDDYFTSTKEDFSISEQFYFTDAGINFVYPPYALRAYAYGNVVLTAPWYEIEEIINPEYKWKK